VIGNGRALATADDLRRQAAAAGLIGRCWGCEVHAFAPFSPLDYYTVTDGRMSGLIEIKSRSHPAHQYPTVYLAVRKWLALMLGEVGMDLHACFVAAFTDSTRWIYARDVDASRLTVGGRSDRGRTFDREPVIHVPVVDMSVLQ
jgi:hypothetical protein